MRDVWSAHGEATSTKLPSCGLGGARPRCDKSPRRRALPDPE
ncbi:hypothetical protein HMPREF9341_01634 [Cutibacterium acnes HL103PA1]|nr:hypothetical protein HMPREF9341_01634 [Cutibacterium acnes HL103PA1]